MAACSVRKSTGPGVIQIGILILALQLPTFVALTNYFISLSLNFLMAKMT